MPPDSQSPSLASCLRKLESLCLRERSVFVEDHSNTVLGADTSKCQLLDTIFDIEMTKVAGYQLQDDVEIVPLQRGSTQTNETKMVARTLLLLTTAVCLLASASAMAVIPGFKTTFDVLKPGKGGLVGKGSKVTVHATVRPIPWLLLQSDRSPWVLS
jgi:hypothetical protein